MNIGIVGVGFVGSAMLGCFERRAPVFTFDTRFGLERHHEGIREVIRGKNPLQFLSETCQVVFLAVPTPMDHSGRQDLSILNSVMQQLAQFGDGNLAVVKSTVLPGTTDRIAEQAAKLRVAFNPEFLRERTAREDFANQDRVIIGARCHVTELEALYSRTNPTARQVLTDPVTAELVKYATNCFLATKVSFANEFHQICQSLGTDYGALRELLVLDPRIGESHLAVPGHDGRKGFGMSCLPKDLNAMLHLAKDSGVDARVLRAVWEKNLEVRPDRDWEQLRGRAVTDDLERRNP
jgi:nucleotide sugar dehydrogenase